MPVGVPSSCDAPPPLPSATGAIANLVCTLSSRAATPTAASVPVSVPSAEASAPASAASSSSPSSAGSARSASPATAVGPSAPSASSPSASTEAQEKLRKEAAALAEAAAAAADRRKKEEEAAAAAAASLAAAEERRRKEEEAAAAAQAAIVAAEAKRRQEEQAAAAAAAALVAAEEARIKQEEAAMEAEKKRQEQEAALQAAAARRKQEEEAAEAIASEKRRLEAELEATREKIRRQQEAAAAADAAAAAAEAKITAARYAQIKLEDEQKYAAIRASRGEPVAPAASQATATADDVQPQTSFAAAPVANEPANILPLISFSAEPYQPIRPATTAAATDNGVGTDAASTSGGSGKTALKLLDFPAVEILRPITPPLEMPAEGVLHATATTDVAASPPSASADASPSTSAAVRSSLEAVLDTLEDYCSRTGSGPEAGVDNEESTAINAQPSPSKLMPPAEPSSAQVIASSPPGGSVVSTTPESSSPIKVQSPSATDRLASAVETAAAAISQASASAVTSGASSSYSPLMTMAADISPASPMQADSAAVAPSGRVAASETASAPFVAEGTQAAPDGPFEEFPARTVAQPKPTRSSYAATPVDDAPSVPLPPLSLPPEAVASSLRHTDVSSLRSILLAAKVALARERLDCEMSLTKAEENRRDMRAAMRAQEIATAAAVLSKSITSAEASRVPVHQSEADLLSSDALIVASAVDALAPASSHSAAAVSPVNPAGPSSSEETQRREVEFDRAHAAHLSTLMATAAAVRARVEVAAYDRSLRQAVAPLLAAQQQRLEASAATGVVSPLQAVASSSSSPSEDPSLTTSRAERDALAEQRDQLAHREAAALASIARHEAVEAALQARCNDLLQQFEKAQEGATAVAAAAQMERLQLTAEVRRLTAAAETAQEDARARASQLLQAHVQQAVVEEEASLAAKLRQSREQRAADDAASRAGIDAKMTSWLAGLVKQAAGEILSHVQSKALEAARTRRDVVEGQRDVASLLLSVQDSRELIAARQAAKAAAEEDQRKQEEMRQQQAVVRRKILASTRGGAFSNKGTSASSPFTPGKQRGAAGPTPAKGSAIKPAWKSPVDDSSSSSSSAHASFSEAAGKEVDGWISSLRGGGAENVAPSSAARGRRGSMPEGVGSPAAPASARRGATSSLAPPPILSPAGRHRSSSLVAGSAGRNGLLSPAQLSRALSGGDTALLSALSLAPAVPVSSSNATSPSAAAGLSSASARRAALRRAGQPLIAASKPGTISGSKQSSASASTSPSAVDDAEAAFASLVRNWEDKGVPLRGRIAALVALTSTMPYSCHLSEAWRAMGVAVGASERLYATCKQSAATFSAKVQERAEVTAQQAPAAPVIPSKRSSSYASAPQPASVLNSGAAGSRSPPAVSPAGGKKRVTISPSPPRVYPLPSAPVAPSTSSSSTSSSDLDLSVFLDYLRAHAPADALPPKGQVIPSFEEGRQPAVVSVDLMVESPVKRNAPPVQLQTQPRSSLIPVHNRHSPAAISPASSSSAAASSATASSRASALLGSYRGGSGGGGSSSSDASMTHATIYHLRQAAEGAVQSMKACAMPPTEKDDEAGSVDEAGVPQVDAPPPTQAVSVGRGTDNAARSRRLLRSALPVAPRPLAQPAASATAAAPSLQEVGSNAADKPIRRSSSLPRLSATASKGAAAALATRPHTSAGRSRSLPRNTPNQSSGGAGPATTGAKRPSASELLASLYTQSAAPAAPSPSPNDAMAAAASGGNWRQVLSPSHLPVRAAMSRRVGTTGSGVDFASPSSLSSSTLLSPGGRAVMQRSAGGRGPVRSNVARA